MLTSVNCFTCYTHIITLIADIDECAEGTSGCSNFCVNDPGSFHCDCPLGFELGDDGLTCQGILIQFKAKLRCLFIIP